MKMTNMKREKWGTKMMKKMDHPSLEMRIRHIFLKHLNLIQQVLIQTTFHCTQETCFKKTVFLAHFKIYPKIRPVMTI